MHTCSRYNLGLDDFRLWAAEPYGWGVPNCIFGCIAGPLYETWVMKPHIDQAVEDGLAEIRDVTEVHDWRILPR